MPNRLDLPPELNSLIEKREQEDRRQPAADGESNTNTEQSAKGDSADGERRASKGRRATDS